MNHERKIRSCNKSRSSEKQKPCLLHRQLCIYIEPEEYENIWSNAKKVRELLDQTMKESPELFPKQMREQGYRLTGHLPESKKMPGITLRQIRVGKIR